MIRVLWLLLRLQRLWALKPVGLPEGGAAAAFGCVLGQCWTRAQQVCERVLAGPRCLQVRDSWAVAGRLSEVPGSFIAAALLPALIVTVLFYFDHNVSSQMAQQPEYHLVKGPAYHWDFLLLSGLVRRGTLRLLCARGPAAQHARRAWRGQRWLHAPHSQHRHHRCDRC